MSTIKNFLVITLMSVLTSGVAAQTTSTTNDESENEPEMVMILNSLEMQTIKENLKVNNRTLNFIQKDHLKDILRTGSTEGSVWKNDALVNSSRKGDEWKAYLTKKNNKFFLTYLVTRNEHLVGMSSIPLN